MDYVRSIFFGKSPPKDLIHETIGSFGKYQLFIFLLVCLNKAPMAMHQMAIIFLAPKVEYTCPGTTGPSCPCPNPQYDKSIFTNTIIMKWDLICDRKWLANFSQTLFQLGTLIGSILFGMASDRFGRKYPLIIACIIEIVAGLSAAYVPNFWMFNIIRFIVGASVGGTMVIGFVIVMEFVGASYRAILSALYQVPFNLGHMMLPLIGYLIRDYSLYQTIISLTMLPCLLYLCFLPETPMWLLAERRTEESIKVLSRAAKRNNKPEENIRPNVEAYQAEKEKHSLKKGNILDLFRTPNLRMKTLVIAFDWLTCSYCFYGLSQYVGQLHGDVFTNVLSGASLTLLGTLSSIPIMRAYGRKPIVIACNYICAGCLILLACIPEGIASVVCASVGKVTSFIVFILAYLYGSELFPTVVRNAGMGFSSMSARVGSMLAPFVIGLRDIRIWLPPTVFAILPLIAGTLTFLLPETKNTQLMTTIEEGEQFGKKTPTAAEGVK